MLMEVKRGRVGAIILFEKNIPAANSFQELKKITWAYHKVAPVPLLMSIDQEGGKVNRLKEKYGFPRSITAQAMGKSNSLDSVRFYSESTAATLAGLGINLNFAPVVDVAVNPENPVTVKNGRSFSANEDSVVWLAWEFIRAHRKLGVITTLKHFPGHGSSKGDTHFGMQDVTETWQPRELKPFQSLINSRSVDAIMSAHIVNKNLEPEGLPGTLSKRVIQGLLRDSLRYNGVVFSDDMHMHAISRNYGLEESIRLCINAGVDILCFANNVPPAERVTADQLHTLIRKLVNEGKISPQRIQEAYQRVIKLKKRLTLNDAFSLQEQLDLNFELAEKYYQQAKAERDRTVAAERAAKEAQDRKSKKRKAKKD